MFKSKSKDVSITVSTDKCTGCGLCVARCRHNAMGLVKLKDQTYAMLVHPENCKGCGKCVRKCHSKAIEITEQTNYMEAFIEFL